MKKLLTIVLLFGSVLSQAQYVTPGTGINWNMDSLVLHSNGAVISTINGYQIKQNLAIDTSDIISVSTASRIELDSMIQFDIYGSLSMNPQSGTIILTAHDTTKVFKGIYAHEASTVLFKKTLIEWGGGIKVSDCDFYMDSCFVRKNQNKLSTAAAIDIVSGHPIIMNSTFEGNRNSAISSGANIASAPVIYKNIFINNGYSNANRPQINLGPSGTDTAFIIQNIVTGGPYNNIGGIAFSSLLGVPGNVIIAENTIENNRYGITITGSNINGNIINNNIADNNIQNNPNLGGSGINLTASNGNQYTIIKGNTITGNLWGITLVGKPTANIGDTSTTNYNPGLNEFSNNGNNNKLVDLYNNTPNTIKAMGNCWNVTIQDSISIDSVIVHKPDIDTLGIVIFMPSCSTSTSIQEAETMKTFVYPNPATESVNIEFTQGTKEIVICNSLGQIVFRKENSVSDNAIQINVSSWPDGLYIITINNEKNYKPEKLLIRH